MHGLGFALEWKQTRHKAGRPWELYNKSIAGAVLSIDVERDIKERSSVDSKELQCQISQVEARVRPPVICLIASQLLQNI